MFMHQLKIICRKILSNKLHSILNIVGLAELAGSNPESG